MCDVTEHKTESFICFGVEICVSEDMRFIYQQCAWKAQKQSSLCLTASRYRLFIGWWLLDCAEWILTLLVTIWVFRTSSGPPLCSLIPRTSSSSSPQGRSAVALAVAVGRGIAGRAALVAGRWRGADPGQTRTLCGALLRLFGLRFAVLLPTEDRWHVVQGKDFYSGQKHTADITKSHWDTAAPKHSG